MRRWSFAVVVLLLVAAWAPTTGHAQAFCGPGNFIACGGTITNTQQTSAAATSNVITLTGLVGARIRVYGVNASCSAGTATLTITDGGTTVWSMPGSVVPTTPTVLSLWWGSAPYVSTGTNQNVVVTVGSCGASNTSSLVVQSERY